MSSNFTNYATRSIAWSVNGNNQLVRALEDLKKTLQELKTSLEGMLADLSAQIQTINTSLQIVNLDISALQTDVASIQTTISAIQTSVNNLLARIQLDNGTYQVTLSADNAQESYSLFMHPIACKMSSSVFRGSPNITTTAANTKQTLLSFTFPANSLRSLCFVRIRVFFELGTGITRTGNSTYELQHLQGGTPTANQCFDTVTITPAHLSNVITHEFYVQNNSGLRSYRRPLEEPSSTVRTRFSTVVDLSTNSLVFNINMTDTNIGATILRYYTVEYNG